MDVLDRNTIASASQCLVYFGSHLQRTSASRPYLPNTAFRCTAASALAWQYRVRLVHDYPVRIDDLIQAGRQLLVWFVVPQLSEAVDLLKAIVADLSDRCCQTNSN